MDLKDLGYNDFFESGRKQAKLDAFDVARVMAEHRGLYRVFNASGEFLAKITGRQMFNAVSREDYPAVGDWVAISKLDTEQAVIRGIIPRKTILKRKEIKGSDVQLIAANVDVAFIVQAVGRDFNVNRLERYAAMIAAGGVKLGIILNKADLIDKSELDRLVSQINSRFPESRVTTTSALTDKGLDELLAVLERGQTYCFIGSSGVGKSSIINKLLKEDVLTVGEIGTRTKKGRHVTTARSLFLLDNGAMVIDNPGMRELGVIDSDLGVEMVFDEILEIAKSCKFADCTHTNEPGCAVRKAIESGELDQKQYENYEKLSKENEFHSMTTLEKRRKDKTFGKFIKKVKERIEEDEE